MMIKTEGGYVNSDTIVSIKDVADKRAIIKTVDGETHTVASDACDVAALMGQIIPAAPGFFSLDGIYGDDNNLGYENVFREPVLAWIINGDGARAVMRTGIEEWMEGAVLYPDGTVASDDGALFESVEAWQREMQKRRESPARKAAESTPRASSPQSP